MLERLTIWPVSSQATKSAPDDDNKDDAPQPTIPLTPPTIGSVSAAAPPRHSVKALVIALWAIAVAIVFHALSKFSVSYLIIALAIWVEQMDARPPLARGARHR